MNSRDFSLDNAGYLITLVNLFSSTISKKEICKRNIGQIRALFWLKKYVYSFTNIVNDDKEINGNH